MPVNRNVLMRIRTIDACLGRRHRQWTLEDLREACEEALYDYEGISSISLRTIQRDIELMRSDKLGYNAPIEVVDRKYYTYADPDFSITKLPLTEEDLMELSSAVDIIGHYRGFRGLSGLEETLTRMQDKIHSQVSHEQVVFLETNDQLKGLEFLGPLYEYIVQKKPIVVMYRSFRSDRTIQYQLSPYLLKEYNNRWFVMGYSTKFEDVQIMALDRIVGIEVDTKGVFRENDFFDPATYLDEMIGVTRELNSVKERVTLWIDANHAPYIITKPLHSSQQLVEFRSDGSLVVAMDLILNLELERLIMGFGAHVEVLSPKSLRQRIAQRLLHATTRYTD